MVDGGGRLDRKHDGNGYGGSFSGGLLCLHLADDLLEFEGVELAEVESQVHCLVAVLECSEFGELNAVLVEFWMLLQVGLQL